MGVTVDSIELVLLNIGDETVEVARLFKYLI